MSADSLAPTIPWNNDRRPLAERLAAEMVERWHTGERPTAHEYLAEHSELRGDKQAVLLLIYEEFCLRDEFAEPSSTTDEVMAQFPQWQADFEILLECHRLLEPEAPAAPVDERPELGDYLIIDELGRGSQGIVYLATQGSLADRPVVLKITPRVAREHLALARLQHTNIVPLYAVQDNAETNTRLLCMPYFGGATLRQLLDALADKPVARRTGRDVLDALGALQERAPLASVARGNTRSILEGATYIEAMCWMAACLADALHYAHERGLVHLDVKPTNVLFTADGQPMLLDFHSAQPPIRPRSAIPEWLGGTPMYMSPEQRRALSALQVGEAVPTAVDGRSDVYSLGLVLFETLGGRVVDDGDAPLIDVARLAIAPGLRDIIGHCLANNPAERYKSAAELADDLRRHLNDQPLQGVPNRSPLERWQKWRRRRPLALRVIMMAAAVLVAFVVLGIASWTHYRFLQDEAQAHLWRGREQFELGAHLAAAKQFEQGLALARSLPGEHELIRPLERELARAQRAALLHDLNRFAEQLRLVSGALAIPGTLDETRTTRRRQIAELSAAWQQLWPERKRILNRGDLPLTVASEEQARTDLLDAGLIWADLSMRFARAEERKSVQASSFTILRELETEFGATPLLAFLKQNLTARGNLTPDLETPPRTTWEKLMLGRLLLHAGDVEQATGYFADAADSERQSFWPHFYHGVAAWQLKDLPTAATAFRFCTVLRKSAECHCNLGRVLAEQGDTGTALIEFNRALEIDPHLEAAAFSRGLLHLQAERYEAASSDFHRALVNGANPARVHCQLAVLHLAQGNRSAARRDVALALQADPQNASARKLQRQLEADSRE